MLYGTARQSNKKDWHILRNVKEKTAKLRDGRILVSPDLRWDCSIQLGEVKVNAAVRIGKDWWRHLGGETCLVELMTALIRGCVIPAQLPKKKHSYTVRDLSDIVSMDEVRDDFNVGLLQRSQLPWLFLVASHFCDELKW